ncbi:Cthe_2314 family HEPN domain-containing protein [Priestia aryabhattai]|uniref:Cthe_2314 family HEPN domain-containing protein n=1 Tax=Priestia aryabhattai TaxID=412384 RepID=UPI0020414E5C|nr:Cthe_2314 family HEPN domain-containing protein [Priestia aryabhattai]MCM3641403.1 Cthe_2314 family HEPN domain-containing protein [Priestia aryabhattai]
MNRRIDVDLFEFPTREEMLPLLKESPLYSYNLKKEIFERGKLSSLHQAFNYPITVSDLTFSLNNRIFQTNLSYAYVSFYFRRGIPDELDSLMNLTNKQFTNRMHFQHHTDALFQRVFTALDLLGQIIFHYYDLEQHQNHKSKISPTFKKVVKILDKKDKELSEKLSEIKDCQEFMDASKVRNDIVHNNPPYNAHFTQEKHSSGITAYGTHYYSSQKLMVIMDNLLKIVRRIFDIVEAHIQDKKQEQLFEKQ